MFPDTDEVLKHLRESYPTQWPMASEYDILRQFYADVCAETERIIEQTGTVSGAHWNAMKRVLRVKGIEVPNGR